VIRCSTRRWEAMQAFGAIGGRRKRTERCCASGSYWGVPKESVSGDAVRTPKGPIARAAPFPEGGRCPSRPFSEVGSCPTREHNCSGAALIGRRPVKPSAARPNGHRKGHKLPLKVPRKQVLSVVHTRVLRGAAAGHSRTDRDASQIQDYHASGCI
jgi:hypothetical protein